MFSHDCPALPVQSRKVRTQLARLGIGAIFACALILCVLSAPVGAAVYKQINFEWEYDTTLPELAGYILYQDDQLLHTIQDPTALSVDLSVGLVPGQRTSFSMKAFDVNGNESALSAPYILDVPSAVENNNFLPIVVASLSTTSGDAPLAIEMTAAGSTDFDGTIAGYAWDFGDGGAAQTASVAHTYTTAGTYTVTLRVTDNDGGVSVVERTVTVSGTIASNSLPTAMMSLSASSGQAPLLVEFSPEGSRDSDGSIAIYAWDFGDGESMLTSAASRVAHTYTVAGTYTATLTVTDNTGGVGMTQANIVVAAPPPNVPPAARMSLSTRSGRAPLSVEFSAQGSADSDGTIVSYRWDFGDGATASTASASHNYSVAGIYTVTLTVTDNDGAIGKAQDTITVAAANKLPTAVVNLSPQSGRSPLVVGFSAAGSTDSDGTIVSYGWDFGDGGSAVTDTGSHTFTAAGEYLVTLTVVDNDGGIGKAQGTVIVLAPNQAPTAVANLSPVTGTAPLVIEFSGLPSTDADGTIAGYAWDFGDGTTSAVSSGSHTYASAGSYPVTLTVTDNDGAVGTTSSTVTVVAPNQAPVASFSPTRTSGEVPFTVVFDASSSNDVDGEVVSYFWSFGDGSSTSGGSSVSHTYTTSGSFPVRLTVMDNEGAQGVYELVIVAQMPLAVPVGPVADFTMSSQQPTAKQLVLFSASASKAAPGRVITSYQWEFGDGKKATGLLTSHRYMKAGTYTVQLTVWDDLGLSGQKRAQISVGSSTR